MSEDTKEEEKVPDLLTMSDEEIMNMELPEDPVEEEETEDSDDDTSTEEDDETEEEQEKDEEDASQSDDEELESDKEANTSDKSEDPLEDTDGTSKDDEAGDAELNYEEEYKKLTSKFKANGKEMQVSNVDDALTLMKMGANYNKKMAGLKPNLKLMKMLENNDLLDESKLSYLIDLSRKDPKAVKKLIKESGIDTLEIDTEKDTEYTPSTYTVDDKEVELDGILDDIRHTESFNETIDVIGNKWDASSKKAILDQPHIIKVINEQVSNGIFEQITSVMDTEQSLGRLDGLSDLEAYKKVGEQIQARGGFRNKAIDTANEEASTEKLNKATDDPKLKNRKRAASSSKSSPSSSKKEEDFNPLALSDADFEKLALKEFM